MNNLVEEVKQKTAVACGLPHNKLGSAFFERHIVLVEEYALQLAEHFQARSDLLSVAAYVHDLAAISNYADLPMHHEKGAELVREILKGKLPAEEIALVADMTLHHNVPVSEGPIDRILFSNADSMSKFNSPLFWISYGCKMKFSDFYESANWYKKMIEQTFAMLLPKAQELSREKFEQACAVVRNEII